MLGRRAWNLPPCTVPVLGPSAFVCVIYTQFAESTRRKILFSLPNGPHLPRLPGMSLGISLPRMCSGFLIQKQILKTAKHLAGSYFQVYDTCSYVISIPQPNIGQGDGLKESNYQKMHSLWSCLHSFCQLKMFKQSLWFMRVMTPSQQQIMCLNFTSVCK